MNNTTPVRGGQLGLNEKDKNQEHSMTEKAEPKTAKKQDFQQGLARFEEKETPHHAFGMQDHDKSKTNSGDYSDFNSGMSEWDGTKEQYEKQMANIKLLRSKVKDVEDSNEKLIMTVANLKEKLQNVAELRRQTLEEQENASPTKRSDFENQIDTLDSFKNDLENLLIL